MQEKLPDAVAAASHFINNEMEFRLGVLPTEQPHPGTVGLAETALTDTQRAIAMIQQVDHDIFVAAERALSDPAFQRLCDAMFRAFTQEKTIYLSGCGATGRVSLLLEASWRRFWRRLQHDAPDRALGFPSASERIHGMITGGDYALVRSVESFEDYVSFGRRQLRDAGVRAGDVVVAITEGGETSSVIGTAWQGVDAGAEVFFLCNNPSEVLIEHVARSREILTDSRITHLNLASGPMAVAGSTRMQATTCEILMVGAAIEIALTRWVAPCLGREPGRWCGLDVDCSQYLSRFSVLLDALSGAKAVAAIGGMAEREEKAFAARGAVTYMANDYMLDIFTDTTERAPTFMLPPLRRSDDARAPRPWSVVKHLFLSTPRAWEDVFQRAPRCLDWNPVTYQELGASERIQRLPPAIRFSDLLQFAVGAEDDPSRHATADDVATLLLVGPETFADASEEARLMEAFRRLSEGFPHRSALLVGSGRLHAEGVEETFRVPVDLAVSPLMLWDHLAVKLVLNTVSTVTMARMGRLVSNWMAHVETTNKKLIDRGTRLVACLTGMSYEDACVALHQTIAELADWPPERGEKPSPVALTVQRFRNSRKA